MYLGKFVELGNNGDIFGRTLHPYTNALLGAVPTIEKGLKREEPEVLTGEVPSPINIPPGCSFESRCPKAMEICKHVEPELIEFEEDHYVACHLYTSGN
jgi:oligopeptide/dipeptide ABC transporter ATP-binding protein